MQRESKTRQVTIEEHVVTVTLDDLAQALEAEFLSEDEENPAVFKPEDLRVCVGVGEGKILGPSELMNVLRRGIERLPEGAEIVLAVRWQEEVEAEANPPAPMGQPGYPPAPQSYYPPQPVYHHPPPPPPQPYYPPQQPQYQAPPQAPPQQQQQRAPTCTTCGGQPDVQGPTPECMDPLGCGRVLQQRGPMPVGRAVPPPNMGAVGAGILRGGGGKLVNRETGESAFADATGGPYGAHDYDRR